MVTRIFRFFYLVTKTIKMTLFLMKKKKIYPILMFLMS